ncbi:zinc ABC transporter substrate-binding protein [Marinobacter antarcticus]|uniref:High-affinity zinc uptake system protein ZnuA n=1 Tax=Marinobacter antarcticus TaxID=564117 RepID=A0A831R2K8_9GAMM|nr:zinc ABC transporter substrate-binding protein [Marinobacter antarcticus]HEA50995.1 ABC transporter substrate-binding protein [Marinobacter antarcticus]
MRSFKTVFALALSASVVLYTNTALADVRILTSIKPLELLVRAVATDDMHTSTLVPAGASPHSYSITPSKRRALESADIIFWVGPEMETFLNRLLTGREFANRSVALMKLDTENSPEDHEINRNEHDHGEGEDPHIWVDPLRAIAMAESIRDALAQLEGADKSALDRNLKTFRASIIQTQTHIQEHLEPLQNVSLFAYHNAFTRFAKHYNLNVEAVLTLNPELSPGARHIADVQKRLSAAKHPCLLTEPQFNRQWWRSITEGLDITFSTWDPMATDIDTTANGYAAFQQSIADAALKCLPENAQH